MSDGEATARGVFATVDSALLRADGGAVDVRFAVDEHAKVTVSDIMFTGNRAIESHELRQHMSTGPPGALSFITGSGVFRRDDLEIVRGKRVYVEQIAIGGNSKTSDRVIRREMRIAEGELFSATNLEQSRQRVMALGYLDGVAIPRQANHGRHTLRRVFAACIASRMLQEDTAWPTSRSSSPLRLPCWRSSGDGRVRGLRWWCWARPRSSTT